MEGREKDSGRVLERVECTVTYKYIQKSGNIGNKQPSSIYGRFYRVAESEFWIRVLVGIRAG